MDNPTLEQGNVSKGGCDPMESPSWSKLLAGLVIPWGTHAGTCLFLKGCAPWKGPTLEQIMKNCYSWEGPMLEKLMEDCLPWERPHTGTGEECEEWQRQHMMN
ncbi:neurexin-3-hypothetical protein [Limosa lapponica baueri]|uniref:Uncharacterized protein n=1 Tax=Limosa lapponica baueri TaxID=1758121 RepID=A0A2I0TW64_LIMLA|nr:neurexin-3-hypothetical protein [Limosa lapponica baueri]